MTFVRLVVGAIVLGAEALVVAQEARCGDYPVPQQRLWDVFADPRQLEPFWGQDTRRAPEQSRDVLGDAKKGISKPRRVGST